MARKNTSLSWRAPLGTCRDIQGYHFSYDGVNRLRGATFWERSSGAPTITDKYSEPLVNYNLNGNITTYPLAQVCCWNKSLTWSYFSRHSSDIGIPISGFQQHHILPCAFEVP